MHGPPEGASFGVYINKPAIQMLCLHTDSFANEPLTAVPVSPVWFKQLWLGTAFFFFFSVTVNPSLPCLSLCLSNPLCVFEIMFKGFGDLIGFVVKAGLKSVMDQIIRSEEGTPLLPLIIRFPGGVIHMLSDNYFKVWGLGRKPLKKSRKFAPPSRSQSVHSEDSMTVCQWKN